MNEMANKSWGLESIKGLLALLLAIIIFSHPGKALITLATYLGILALIAGIIITVRSLYRKHGAWQMWLTQGVINILIGLLVVAYPKATAGLLIFVIGLWITLFGIIQLVSFMQLRHIQPARSLMLLSTVLSLIVGVMLLFNPFEGAVLATIVIGVYAILFAATRFYMAWMLYNKQS